MVKRQLEVINERLNNQDLSLPIYIISVDPKRDTIHKRKNFLKNSTAASNWNFIATDKTKTKEYLSELKMGYSENVRGGHVMHTMTLAVLNSTGEILEVIPVLSDKTEVAVVKIQALISK